MFSCERGEAHEGYILGGRVITIMDHVDITIHARDFYFNLKLGLGLGLV